MTRMVLVNAVYFKGLWAQQFDKENTRVCEGFFLKSCHNYHDLLPILSQITFQSYVFILQNTAYFYPDKHLSSLTLLNLFMLDFWEFLVLQDQDFWTSESESIKAPMMFMAGKKFQYRTNTALKASMLGLDYKVSMYLLLLSSFFIIICNLKDIIH